MRRIPQVTSKITMTPAGRMANPLGRAAIREAHSITSPKDKKSFASEAATTQIVHSVPDAEFSSSMKV